MKTYRVGAGVHLPPIVALGARPAVAFLRPQILRETLTPRTAPRHLQDAMQSTPRKLTTHQKAVLIQALAMFPEQQAGIFYSPTSSDAQAYAQEFLTIFKAVGWTVADPEPTEIARVQSANLTVIVSDEATLPPAAEALHDTLQIFRMNVEVSRDFTHKIASGSFILAIG
jgi:hypothetical protein